MGDSKIELVILAAGVLAIVFAITEALSFSFPDFTLLVASCLIAAMIGRFKLTIPATSIALDPKLIITFWSVVWLGVPGAVLVMLAASLSELAEAQDNAAPNVHDLAAEALVVAVSARSYTLAATNFRNNPEAAALGNGMVPVEMILSILVMAAVFFLATVLTTGLRNESVPAGSVGLNRDRPSLVARRTILAVVSTLLLVLAVNHFGLELAWLAVPIAVAVKIGHRMHVRSLEAKTAEIKEASRLHLATVEALATAIDARDQVGLGHVRRTQIYAVGLGRILGLAENDINALKMGALLHDIGKLAVPDHILNKPDGLTPAEAEKTKIHCSVGASILETVGFPYPVVPTVKYHHEAWDGSGYPEGLRGRKIPVTARIIAIADMFDTLQGDRPYRKALSRQTAIKTIRTLAGSKFDPMLTEIFLRNLDIFDAEIEASGLSPHAIESRKEIADLSIDGSVNPTFIDQIKRANHEAFTLFSLARDFSGALKLSETLELLAAKLAGFIPYDTCAIYLKESNDETAKAVHVNGLHASEISGRRLVSGEGATGFALRSRKSVSNVDPALDFAFTGADIAASFRTMAAVPLVAGDRLIGVVSLYASKIESFEDEHLRIFETASKLAADAIEKALVHAETQLHALTDALTGLPNSRALIGEFAREVQRAGRSGTSFQLLILDLDGFKKVNDTFGHKFGDAMLRGIGNVIREQLRDYDFLARYGGDEFVAIVSETDPEFVRNLSRRIEEEVAAFELIDEGGAANVGISIGAASYPSSGQTFDELIEVADREMYRAKERNRLRRMGADMFVDVESIHDRLQAAEPGRGGSVKIGDRARRVKRRHGKAETHVILTDPIQ
ncbi:MAG: diguanylate cyclase [Acidobacteria bacterium]|nr:diguanylate cyclase [Acidobacteriota bacterium]